jgi:hypothetical protein
MDSILFQNLLNAFSASLLEEIKSKIGCGDIHLDDHQSLSLKGHEKRNIKVLSNELITFDDGSTLDLDSILDVYDLMNILLWIEDWWKLEELKCITIRWSINDLEDVAQQNEKRERLPIGSIYDRTKFIDTLHLLRKNHDCNYGITWYDIGFYLDEYCRLPK